MEHIGAEQGSALYIIVTHVQRDFPILLITVLQGFCDVREKTTHDNPTYFLSGLEKTFVVTATNV